MRGPAPLLTELRNCRLPVALQAFASELDGFPPDWAPLSVVAPITEASAEYQAIAYALDTPGVELVLVDRSTDHVFQWQPRTAPTPPTPTADADARRRGRRRRLHGDAVGVEIGDLRPRFAELEAHLLHHGKVRHWSEWWDQYVEQPLADADYATYRQVMVLIGSLFRRLRPAAPSGCDRRRGPRALHVDAHARAPRRDRRRPGRLPVRVRRLPRRQPGRAVRHRARTRAPFEITPAHRHAAGCTG